MHVTLSASTESRVRSHVMRTPLRALSRIQVTAKSVQNTVRILLKLKQRPVARGPTRGRRRPRSVTNRDSHDSVCCVLCVAFLHAHEREFVRPSPRLCPEECDNGEYPEDQGTESRSARRRHRHIPSLKYGGMMGRAVRKILRRKGRGGAAFIIIPIG